MTYARCLLYFGSVLIWLSACGGQAVDAGTPYAPSGMRLDLCQPKGEARKTALIFIHGGGFSSGKRGQMMGYCRLLAKGGFTSVTISYRLTSGGHAYPAAQQDVASAIAWMRGRSGDLGVDPDKIVLIGYSAGGTLALSAGLEDQRVAGIVSVAGISDFAAARSGTQFDRLRRDLDAYRGDASWAAISPISKVNRGDPPVFLFHGKDDRLVPVAQSVVMARALKQASVPVLFRAFEDAGHEIMLPNKHLKTLLTEMTRFLVAIDEG